MDESYKDEGEHLSRKGDKLQVKPPKDITADMVEDAHASGDGAIKRSEEPIDTPPAEGSERSNEKPPNY